MFEDTLGLFSKADSTLVTCLKDTLANTMAFKIKTQGYHWNVTGSDFHQYHELFGEIYADADAATDPLAENIRKLGAFPQGDINAFAKDSRIGGAIASHKASEIVKDLIHCNSMVLKSIVACFAEAERANEQGILNFLAERQDMHEKWQWQLRACLGA